MNRCFILRRTVRLLAGALLASIGFAATACAIDGSGEGSRLGSTGSSHDIVVVVSATATEPRPALTAKPMSLLRAAAESRDTSDGRNGKGSAARVVASAGEFSENLPLTPRRKDGSVEHGLKREALIEVNLDRVSKAVADVRATEPGLDLLRAMDNATRGAIPATLVVISHGLSTTGGFDLRQVRWDADPQAIATELSRRGLLPILTGWRVIFSGLGSTAGAQPPLSRPTRLKLVDYWMHICATAGGACESDNSQLEQVQPATTAAMPTVPVPGVDSVTGPQGEVTYAITDKLLGFRGDSAELSAAAVQYLDGIAAQIRPQLSNQPQAVVTVTGYCADPPRSTREGLRRLSRQRAANVARVLRDAGVRNQIVVIGGGAAPGASATRGGRFDETRAAQMRRVEITVPAATQEWR